MLNNTEYYKEKAKEILETAKELDAENGFLFSTTFDRYLMQLKILEDLRITIEADGTIVTKEYVKGRGNVYTHPAISEYNSTCKSANNTVNVLKGILKDYYKTREEKTEEKDPLLEALGIS